MALGYTMLRLMLTGASGCGAEGHRASLPTTLPSQDAAHRSKRNERFTFLAQPTESQYPDTPPPLDKIKTKIKD